MLVCKHLVVSQQKDTSALSHNIGPYLY